MNMLSKIYYQKLKMMQIIKQITLMLLVFIGALTNIQGQNTENKPAKSFADQWEFVGIAVEELGYTIWGTSPIMGDDGKPKYLYVGSGHNIYGGDCTVSYVMKFKED